IARHGIVNAIAMQGGVEYIRNARIRGSRDLAVKILYEPGRTPDILNPERENGTRLGMRSCESSYEFAIRFDETGDGFSIVRDELVIGCELMNCECHGDQIQKMDLIGKGELRITSKGGIVRYAARIPDGCSLTVDDIIPAFFRGKRLPERTLLLETVYGYPLPHIEKLFDKIAVYDIDPKLPKKGVVITGKRELEEDGANLALVIKTIIENPEKKRKFANLLRDVLPFVEDFSVQKFMDISLI
ncbi:MAG TPA: hypothetical protein HA272_05415, partial [Methanoregula sp.]|nr:hypothetical protein [Methanoregula sp.]